MEDKETKQQKKSKVIKIILSLLLLTLIGGALWYSHEQNTPKYDGQAYNDPVKKGKTWTAGDLVIPGFGEVPVNHTDKRIQITLANSKINQAYFRYKVEVKQGAKNIVLEDSKLIKPGNAITSITTKGLQMKPGKYPMKITINTFSLKDGKSSLNGSEVDATLVIK